MAINISVYSNANSTSRTITFDFVGDVLATDNNTWTPGTAADLQYYFRATTSAKTDNNGTIPVKTMTSFGDLALDNPTRTSLTPKHAMSDTGADYTDIRSMIIDYVYDFIHGHVAGKYSSGCIEQRPMKFT